MALLTDIQNALVDDKSEISPIMLKLRLLASRLDSPVLDQWVAHEIEGYPFDVELPKYRQVGISYHGSFSGPFGSGIRNAPIPPYIIEKHAGKSWNNYAIRQSLAGIEDLLVRSEGKSGELNINAANLILLLQGNIYEDYACNSVVGTLSTASLKEIQYVVRSRLLELTTKIERAVPKALEIGLGPITANAIEKSEIIEKLTQQIVYGNVINSSGNNNTIQTFVKFDLPNLLKYIEDAGISAIDAKEFGDLVASEKPENNQEPFGNKTKKWIAENIKKAANGTWKIGIAVATETLKQAALHYYGLK